MNAAESWYRNPWVWLIIAIPALTVAGCMLTIYLAITRPHTLIGDPNATAPVVGESEQHGANG
tara:strand:- start:1573 stop:1761 length:189 start_codon:yes stop_codon:yes gene_type:complete